MTESENSDADLSPETSIREATEIFKQTRASFKLDIAISMYIIFTIVIMSILIYIINDRIISIIMLLILFLTLIIFFMMRFRNSFHLKESVDRWMINNIRFGFSMNYEFATVSGQDASEKAKNLVFSVYSESEKYYKNHPDSFKQNVKTDSGYVFDLVCTSHNSIILVKQLDAKDEITATDIKTALKEASQFTRMNKQGEIILVSNAEYSKDSLDFVRKNDSGGSRVTFDLVNEEGKSYNPIYIGKRRLD